MFLFLFYGWLWKLVLRAVIKIISEMYKLQTQIRLKITEGMNKE